VNLFEVFISKKDMGTKITKIISEKVYVFFALLLLFSLSIPLINTLPVYAKAPQTTGDVKNGTYTWFDRWTIHLKIGSDQYYARYEDSFNVNVKDSDCDGKIELPRNVQGAHVERAPTKAKVDIDITGAFNSDACTDTSPNEIPNITLLNPGGIDPVLNNFNIFFRVSDDGRHLVWAFDTSQPYTQSGKAADIFLRDSESGDKCQDIIQVNKANGTYKSYELKDGGSGPKPPNSINANPDCRVSEDDPDYAPTGTQLKLGDANKLQNDANPDPGAPGGAGGAAGDDETQSCTGEGLSLGWILCPVVEAVSNFGNYVFSTYIQPMMENNPISLKPDDPFYKSWQGFRFLGNILLIGSLLAVVYSQTRGGGN
jgi:hypothetical protein